MLDLFHQFRSIIKEYEVVYKHTVSDDKKSFEIEFNNKALCDAVGRFEFCSRLLYQLKPNVNGVWELTDNPRINAFIVGFPPSIKWSRNHKSKLIGKSTEPIPASYYIELDAAIKGIKGIKEDEFKKTEYLFDIKNITTNKIFKYKFLNRSRAVVAFSVLWDGNDHPRDHLEVTKSNEIPYFASFPQVVNKTETRTYGDPSKTVDELRNEGFPRETDQSVRGTYLEITRNTSYDNLQEHYKLLNRTQSMLDRVGRSQIPVKYKRELYKDSNYCCSNCGEEYPEKYLAPDHRVPSIVQADNLSATNFKQVLQTLCVRCNQVKRESCKKCPYEHDCKKCAWAFPETQGVSALSVKKLQKLANDNNTTINLLLDELIAIKEG